MQYSPLELEEKWVRIWAEHKVGRGDEADHERPKFSMVMPPPNVTGSLHLGHTMMAAVEDTIVRHKKMTGHNICWVPGTDHAGIATQSVVERALARQGVSRHELGRDEFVKKVWEWKEEKGGRILYQLRRLGCICDWEREAFTFSKELNAAVTTAFVTMYDRGLVHRYNRLVSWSPYLNTALSDIEVDAREFDKPEFIKVPGYDKGVEVGTLWTFKYQLKGSETEFIEVATSRPETMLGDVAVAVNPKDPRYQHMIGKELIHPFLPERRVIIVGDEHCDPEFGTGAVKITPAHDKNDYEVGLRHQLPMITVFTQDGYINEMGGEFKGLHRFAARVQVVKRLEELGLFVEKIKNPKKMAIPICSRSGDIVEYMLLPQWYVNCKGMAKRAADACRNGDLKILPEGSEKVWYHWLDDCRDWCVSRQLWWGHRIPAYRIVFEKESIRERELWVIAETAEQARERAEEKVKANPAWAGEAFTLEQDEDVLDTWFSSGLFPFSVYGWPKETDALSKFFPTDLLETGSDIIFFWVARMVMMSLELTDELPFKTVFLHPMVCDAHGKKMSKSVGNVLDPLDVIQGISLQKMNEDVLSLQLKETETKRALDAQKKDFPNGIEECGTDALRYGLLAYLKGGRQVNLDIQRVVAYRHFCNKVWNAIKFAMSYLEPANVQGRETREDLKALLQTATSENRWMDRWILHRLNRCAKVSHEGLANFEFYEAVNATYSFMLYEFCDVYLELCKPRFTSGTEEDRRLASATMYACLDGFLRCIHPLMPFVSEECWALLNEKLQVNAGELLVNQSYPTYDAAFEVSDVEMNTFMNCVRQFRSMLAQFEVPPKQKLLGFVQAEMSAAKCASMAHLARLQDVQPLAAQPDGTHIQDITADGIKLALDPAGVVDFSKVITKLNKRKTQLDKLLETLAKKMSIKNYEEKVPEEVKRTNLETQQAYKDELEQIRAAIASAERFV